VSNVKVLYVDDDEPNLELFRLAVGRRYPVLTARNAEQGLQILEREDVGVVVTDQVMPGLRGIDFLARVCERYPNSVRIVVTAYQDVHMLLDAINAGHVSDYVLKPWEPAELCKLLDRAAEQVQRRRALEQMCEERDYLVDEIRQRYDPSEVVGAGAGLRQVMDLVRLAAGGDATVLITGETGTGKELVARAIHAQSSRRSRALVKMDCGSLAPGVLESEMFGHEKGAFTGASRTRRGRFELANGGVLFLDEVSNLPRDLQPKLLRVLQDRELERVGGETTIRVDVRIIAASNQELEQLVAEGSFRRDLYYRLNVVPIRLPPLRDRLADLEALVAHFLRKHGGRRAERVRLTQRALDALRGHSWPGNVRELENVLERALLLVPGEVLDAKAFAFPRAGRPTPEGGDVRTLVARRERDRLREVLTESRGNISEAARRLQLSRSTLRGRLRKVGLI
jgi:DNA-binding NtrC family response regulator